MDKHKQPHWLFLIIEFEQGAKPTVCGPQYQIAFKAQQINSAAIYSDNSGSMRGHVCMTL